MLKNNKRRVSRQHRKGGEGGRGDSSLTYRAAMSLQLSRESFFLVPVITRRKWIELEGISTRGKVRSYIFSASYSLRSSSQLQ